jgi:hypothetical protein
MKTVNKNSYYSIIFAVLAVAAFAAFFLVHIGKRADDTPVLSYNEQSRAPLVYANIDFKITLRYHQGWKPDITKGAFHGNYLSFGDKATTSESFFAIDAIGASGTIPTIEEAVKKITGSAGKPYGTSPTVHVAKISGQDARYIFPSADQPDLHKNEAALVVKYPKPTQIANGIYYYFMLYGDKDHLEEIGNSLQFLAD